MREIYETTKTYVYEKMKWRIFSAYQTLFVFLCISGDFAPTITVTQARRLPLLLSPVKKRFLGPFSFIGPVAF